MSAAWVAALNAWVDLWAAGIGRACWQGGAAILVVWGLCRALPRIPPRVRCWLWRLAYIKLLVALLWAAPVEIPLLRSTPTPAPLSGSVAVPVPPSEPSLPPQRSAGMGGPARVVFAKPTLSPLSALMLLWLLGALVVGAQTVREWRSARRRAGVAPLDRAVHGALAADFETLCRRLGARRPIALLVTGAGDRPHVVGVVRPAIVVPAELLAGSDRTGLRAVLAHEIAHVTRKDLLWNWLPALAHALFYFCPLVWLANREWQLAQEIACDELAIRHTRIDAADYGEMLVRMVAPSRRSLRPDVATLGIVETPQTLKRRLIAMRSIHPMSPRRLALAGGACAALGIVGIVPLRAVAQAARANPILFASNRQDPKRFSLFAMDPDGSHVRRLIRGPVPELEVVSGPDGKLVLRPAASHAHAMELDPVWSPDGKRIAFTLAVSEKPQSPVKMNLYVVNADGTGCKEVTHFAYGLHVTSPAWSPDGKRIAFTLQSRNDRAPGGIDTTVCVTDFERFSPVAEGMCPLWSADGGTILYSAFADSKGLTTDLYERRWSGVGEKKKRLAGVLRAALSPDGKRLAYIADQSGAIVVSNADGSQPTPLTRQGETGAVGVQWSSDGRQIYFARPRADHYQLFAMDADGSHLRTLTRGDAPDYPGSAPGLLLVERWMDRIVP